MTRALTVWREVAEEARQLASTVYADSVVDGECAPPEAQRKFAVRLASLRGMLKGVRVQDCALAGAVGAAQRFLPLARAFADPDAPPKVRMDLSVGLMDAATELGRTLAPRHPSDVDG